MKEKKAQELVEWWSDTAVVVPDPYQEAKPKLTSEEIRKAAELYKGGTFVNSQSQMKLYHIIKDKCHRDTFNAWWKLVCGHNMDPLERYTVDDYIAEKGLGIDKCNNKKCGACECD